jgi:hypothetical protein
MNVSVRTQSLRPSLNNFVPRAIKDLIQDCWQTEPESRPNFDEILERLTNLQQHPSRLSEANHSSPSVNTTPKRSHGIKIKATNVSILSSSEKQLVQPLYESV